MKTLSTLSLFLVFVSGILAPSLAFAEKMSPETQDYVINKMERVISAMGPNDSSRPASLQRLADLLSERARQRFMLEIEANCQGCKGSTQDRIKATGIYEDLLKTRELKGDGFILFQLAHLYQMAGKNNKAQSLYEALLKSAKKQKLNPIIITRSHADLGDLLFQKGQFSKAHYHYTVALRDKNLDNRSLIIYNKAWCEFNQEKISTAIATLTALLSRPEQILRETDGGSVYDKAFHTDILRDLATFYARKSVKERDINAFEKLIPKDHRKEMLMHFATEVDRVGQKKAARIILDKYLQDKTLTDDERLHAFIMKAQVSYDNGLASQSTADFAKAAKTLRDEGCEEDKCEKLQKAMKYYVTELHRSQKLKPTQDLLKSYSIYGETFPEDKEMHLRGAQVAVEMGQYTSAIGFYRNISTNRKFKDAEREEALLSEVATAEKSGNSKIKKDSYVFFIKKSDNEKKVFEVRYQLAYLSYQNKEYREAAQAFNELAEYKKGRPDLRKKSADLSLDALAILKDDEKLEEWAWDYAEIFPKNKVEFETLARKALINQAALAANNPKSSTSDLRKHLSKIWKAPLSNATPQERILFFTNARVLSLKVQDHDSYLKAQNALLNQRGVTAQQKQEIYESLAAFYEERLDFKSAYTWALKVKNSKLSKAEREFRLGTLADLSMQRPEKHYRAALKAGLRDGRSIVVRSRLVALSRNPVSELKKQAPYLKRQPVLLNDMVLFVYAKTGNIKPLKSLLNTKELRHRSAARFLLSQNLYDRIETHQRKIARASLKSHTNSALQRSTAERMKLLDKTDKLLNESIQMKDITAQMMMLDTVARENERFVEEMSALPKPKGLNEAQLNQYTMILKEKMRPFLSKAKMAEQKRDELWNSSTALAQLIQNYSQARPEIQKLMVRPLRLLSEVSGSGTYKGDLKDALSGSRVTVRDLVSARKSVSENPDDRREIENLIGLESKLGHPLMPAYLEVRLNHLGKGKKL